jgi:hypothetical protein
MKSNYEINFDMKNYNQEEGYSELGFTIKINTKKLN